MSRRTTLTEKIPRDVTGLNGSLFVHAEFDARGQLDKISFSEKGKEDSTLDRILCALGASVTTTIRAAKKTDGAMG